MPDDGEVVPQRLPEYFCKHRRDGGPGLWIGFTCSGEEGILLSDAISTDGASHLDQADDAVPFEGTSVTKVSYRIEVIRRLSSR